MTQVNLLPREVKQRQVTRRRTGAVAVIGGIVVLALVAMWFLQGQRLHKLDQEVDAQNATNAQLQEQVDSLSKYSDLKANLDSRKTLLKSALADTVEWSNVLSTLSNIAPGKMWLTSLTGSATSPSTSAATTTAPVPGAPTGPTLIGNIQFQASSLDSDTMAAWLTHLESVKGWVNAWLSTGQQNSTTGTPLWQFSSTVDLEARVAHGGGKS